MTDNGIVYGDTNTPLFIGSDYVYVRKDFEQVLLPKNNPEDPDLYSWKFHEYKYTVKEYTDLLQQQNEALQKELVEMQISLAEANEGVN